MAGRMSNRERIEQMRAEADAKAREKEAAKAAKAEKATKPRSSGSGTKKAAAKPTARIRLAWSVCDHSGKEVQQFPYAQEAEARAEAEQRTKTTGRTHFVTKAEVRVE